MTARSPSDLLTGATDPDHGETATLTVADVQYAVDGGAGVGDGAGRGQPVGLDADGRPDGRGVQPPGGGRAHDDRGVVQRHGRAKRDGRADRDHHHHRAPTTRRSWRAALTDTAAEGDSSFTKDLLTGATDPDDGETATLTVAGVQYAVDGGLASGTAPAGVSLSGSTLTIDPTDAAFNHLAVGEHTTIVVSLQRHGRAERDGRADRDHHHHRDQRRAGRGERADRYGGRG